MRDADHMTAEHQMPSPDEPGPVHTDDELLERWKLIMGPWGFDQRSLWLIWFDRAGLQLPMVTPIDDLPAAPPPDLARRVPEFVRELFDQLGAAWMSMAWARPGPGLISPDDRAWAQALDVATMAAHGVTSRPLFLATESRVRPLVLDDL